jgi:hypothetical protein
MQNQAQETKKENNVNNDVVFLDIDEGCCENEIC